ncbi:MAG: response regulator [Ruminococcaceae bacterium]|nr:response regulator [Oscillospiraceae bacterium]
MSENVKKTVEFMKKLFCAHLEENKYEESYKSFTDDADIFGLVQNGTIHGVVAIKAALRTFLTFANVKCALTFSEESEKVIAPGIYSTNFITEVKNAETEQVMVLRISAVVVEESGELKISTLDISVVDRNSMPIRYFIDEVELGYEAELYRDILSEGVNAGILGIFNEEEYPLYVIDDNFVRMLGYLNKKELLIDVNNKVVNLIYRDDLPHIQEKLQSLTEGGEKYELTYRVRKKNGRFIWVKNNGKVVKVQERIALVGVCHDVTEIIENKQKLKDTENRFKLAISGAKMLVWEYDIKNKCARYPQGTEIGEIGREVILYDFPDRLFNKDIIIEEQREDFKEFYKRVDFGEEKELRGTFWMLNSVSNIKRCVEISYSVVRDEAGNGIIAYGMSRDITEQKFTEKRFREELAFRNKTGDNIISTSCVNLTLGIVENLRYGESYVKDENIITTIDYRERSLNFLDDCEMTDEQAKNLSVENLLKLFEKGVTEVREEYFAILKGGNKRIWICVDVNILKSPKTGNILAFFYNKDMTKEKMSSIISESILELNYLEVGVIDTEHDVYTRFHSSGTNITRFNNTFDFESGMDVFCEKRVTENDRKRVRKYMSIDYINSAIKKNGIIEFQFLGLDRNGEEEYNSMVIKPLFKGRNDILLSTRSNVDAIVRESQKKEKKLKKAIEEAKKANEARSDFFAGISHDMRTPMNAIIGMSALGVDETKDETIKKYFTNIDASAHFLLGLINDALDSSQIEKNALKLTFEPYSMEEFKLYVNSMVRSLCDAKKIEFNMVVHENFSKCISTDKLRFNQIFFNLLSNAVKFTPENGKIDFIIEFVSRNNGVVVQRFIVKDTGIGMSKDFQKRMFNRFTREGNTSLNSSGTGLGLFITKYVVELMGGTISVNSEVGKGSEFIVELALQEVEVAENQFESPEKLSEDDFDNILKEKRVLLCEDNEMNSQIAVRVLEKKGMIVECAPDGQAGLEKFNNSDEGYYDVILMDVRMPVMDGLEATKFIRNLERMDSKKVPIIAMSANTHKKDIEIALKAGMSTHIGKPFDVKELYKVISLELIKE